MLRFRPSTARGLPVGETHHRARYSDTIVAEARALRLRGWTYTAIARELRAARSTVAAWALGTRRTQKPVRVIVSRVKSPS
jgi:hypothetical protein